MGVLGDVVQSETDDNVQTRERTKRMNPTFVRAPFFTLWNESNEIRSSLAVTLHDVEVPPVVEHAHKNKVAIKSIQWLNDFSSVRWPFITTTTTAKTRLANL